MATDTTVTRFAPSPTGRLHLGHAYSAWVAWAQAAADGGRFLLRIEDIDRGRCRPEFEDGIFEDLRWLGLTWETPVRRQSDHLEDYAKTLGGLRDQGLIYPCFCTRKDIAAEIAAAGHAPHGPDGPLYPGTCRDLDPARAEDRMAAGETYALRLKTDAAAAMTGPLAWLDLTHVHRLLQALLGLDTPVYRHHGLLAGPDGKRLAKRDKAETIESLRAAGHSPANVWAMAGVSAEAMP